MNIFIKEEIILFFFSFEEALKRVKQARSMAEPNPNFINQLINFERTERYKQKVNQPIGDVS